MMRTSDEGDGFREAITGGLAASSPAAFVV